MTILAPHRRGDTFGTASAPRRFTLADPWLGSHFTGGVKFTLRTVIPDSSVVDDDGVVDQASVATGEITFDGAVGTIVIPASRTTNWPARKLFWDVQGVVLDDPDDVVYTLDSGEIQILPDITRSGPTVDS